MRGFAGMLVILSAVNGCAVIREQTIAERTSVPTRGPNPATQTAWKQHALKVGDPINVSVRTDAPAKTAAASAAKAQSPWPLAGPPQADRASGTLVSATYVETSREPAHPVPGIEAPVVSKEQRAEAVPDLGPPPPKFPEIVQTSSVLPPPEPPQFPVPPVLAPSVQPASPITSQVPSAPAVRMVNSKRIHLNYELNEVGESGISGIELWYTQDTKTWKKYDGPAMPQSQGVYAVDVSGEGLYGFTMIARSGVGYSRELPKEGELPQVWVEVDLTRPSVQITTTELKSTPQEQRLSIRWDASDKNLTARPITLSYAEKQEGPWTVLAANLENSGKYEWAFPVSVPKRIFVRIEAADLVGHIGQAQTVESVLIDRSRPKVNIRTVDAEKQERAEKADK